MGVCHWKTSDTVTYESGGSGCLKISWKGTLKWQQLIFFAVNKETNDVEKPLRSRFTAISLYGVRDTRVTTGRV